MAKTPKAEALKLIHGQLEQIENLRNLSSDSMEFKTWKQMTGLYADKIFGQDSKNAKDFEKITFWPTVWYSGMDEAYWKRKCFDTGMNESLVLLKRFIQELELFGEDAPSSPSKTSKATPLAAGKKFSLFTGMMNH